MANTVKSNDNTENKSSKIYLSIDHLKEGNYKLNITLKNKVIKTVKLNKKI